MRAGAWDARRERNWGEPPPVQSCNAVGWNCLAEPPLITKLHHHITCWLF